MEQILPEKLTVPQPVKKFPCILRKVLLPHSQAPSTCPYPEPDQYSPRPIPFLEYSF